MNRNLALPIVLLSLFVSQSFAQAPNNQNDSNSRTAALKGSLHAALPLEGATQAPNNNQNDSNSRTAALRGRLHAALPLEGATQAPNIDPEIIKKVERDKSVLTSGQEITKNYSCENAVAYWETILRAEPNNVYSKEIVAEIERIKSENPRLATDKPKGTPSQHNNIDAQNPAKPMFESLVGTFRIGVNTGFAYGSMSVSNFDSHSVSLGIDADYFVIDFVTIGFDMSFIYSKIDGDISKDFFFGPAIGASALISQRVVPFVKIIPGFGMIDFGFGAALKEFNLGILGGIDVLILKNVAFGLSVRYDRFFTNNAINFITVPLQFAFYI